MSSRIESMHQFLRKCEPDEFLVVILTLSKAGDYHGRVGTADTVGTVPVVFDRESYKFEPNDSDSGAQHSAGTFAGLARGELNGLCGHPPWSFGSGL